MFKRVVTLILLSLIAMSLLPLPTASGQVDDHRTYSLYVPTSYSDDTPVPLVVVLHDGASSGKGIEAITGFSRVAEREGFIALYPDTIDLVWDDGISLAEGPNSDDATQDVEFVVGLLDEIMADYAIDETQVFLTGMGRGGSFAMRLVCEDPGRFAKVLTMGATMPNYLMDRCNTLAEDGEPVSMLNMLGSKDPFFPVEGNVRNINPSIRFTSAGETLDFWATWNGCELDSGQQVGNAMIFDGCANGVSTISYIMDGVGHNWPRVGNYQLNQFGIDLTKIAWQFFTNQPVDWNAEINPAVNTSINQGEPRSYIVYVPPSYTGQEPTPLVVALHGRPSSGTEMAYLLDMRPVADEHGFIVVYPEGWMRGWNYTGGFPGYQGNGQDDVVFLKTMLSDLALDLNIDQTRQYVTGFSNGGFMTQLLACQATETFAAFATIGATLFPGFVQLCLESPAVPMIFMHGTEDPSVPWEGVTQGNNVITAPMETTIRYWVAHGACKQDESDIIDIPDNADIVDDSTVLLFTFGGCENNTRIDFYLINNGGHTIPGVQRLNPQRFGVTNEDILAPEVIWDFFSVYTLNAEAE